LSAERTVQAKPANAMNESRPDRPDFLTNVEAAAFLRLSPRTLEKQRVLGGGPRFHKFGRRVLYSVRDLESWAHARSFEMTCDCGSDVR
jgi:hypothetical protein